MQEFWHKRSSPLLTRHCTIPALPHGDGLAHADPSLRSAPFLGKMVASTANVHLLNTYIFKTRTFPKHVHLQNTYIFKRALLTYISPSQNPSLISIVITKTAVLRGEQLCWFHHHCHNIKEQSYWKSIRIFGKWLL